MAAVIPQAADALATEEQERGKRVVLIIDEAHLLSGEQLEAVGLLTNSERDSRSSCCCLLLDQPTLRRRAKMGAFAAFDQRIALRYHLDGMDLAETDGYLKHHLQLAGRSDPLFADPAVALIHQNSRASQGRSTTWRFSPWLPPSPRARAWWTRSAPGRR